jgi:tetratricopeptide (TPR) repeat protein
MESLNRAIALDPKAAEPHYKLGNVYRRWNRIEDAERAYRKAIALNPRHADALNTLGNQLTQMERFDEAAEVLRKAIAVSPRYAYAHNNLGIALHGMRRLNEAIECYRRAIKLKPDYPEAHSNLGSVYRELDRTDEAIAICKRAAELAPSWASAHGNLANCYADALRLDEAVASYERAIALEPGNPGFHWNLSTKLLLKGDYARGWKEYEWRWRGCPELKDGKPAMPVPEWGGEDISDKTILLYREQGIGDVIQFARYAPMVAALAGKVIVACEPRLVRLLQSLRGVEVVSDQQPLPRFNVHCPLLSLPLRFGTTIGTIPAQVPYLSADPALAAVWQQRLGTTAGKRVALIWGGWAGNRIDRKRSIPLAEFAPLAAVTGVEFYSLQLGEHAAQTKSPPPGLSVIDCTADLHDFADTAALLENLDLLITVDTAGAHLAGAMAKPVWLLNRYESEWRWLLDREDSPWYPTMRIFRQPRPGEWKSVIVKIADALGKLARSRSA